MKTLFFGQIREDLIFPFPRMSSETAETVRMIIDSVQKATKDTVKSSEWDEKGAMPREIITAMAELGLMGLAVPEEFGGLGLKQSGYARVMSDIAAIDGSLAVTLGAHQSIGYKALLLFGSPEQKKKYLPKLASGEMIACYCLTEPGSGSDAASITTKAVPSADGSYYTISGNKLWITNGGIASFMTVFAKTDVMENGEKKEKVSCFIVEAPAQGITVGPPEHKLGIRASWTNAIHFDGVKVPKENMIGTMGQGFKVAMGVLNHGRLGLAAGCVANAKVALKSCLEHSVERVQFKKKIVEFGMIQEKLARIAHQIYVAESMLYMTANLVDRGDCDYSVESAICKVYATEMYWETVDETIQVWGGNGYMKEYPFERWFRDARINRIFEGTNEILRAFIALSGLQGPGQELAGLADVIKYPLKGLGPVSDFVMRKVKQNVFGASITKAHPALSKFTGLLEEYAVEFASQAETLLRRHGREIYLKQFAQKRIAEIAIDLFGMACVISRVTARLEEKGATPESCKLELSIADTYFQRAKRRIDGHFKQIHHNEDESMKAVVEVLLEKGEYPYDILGTF